jgi:hypothetical protein
MLHNKKPPFGAKDPGLLLSNEYLGVLPGELNKLFSFDMQYRNKLVIRQPVTFQDQTYYNVPQSGARL